MIAPLTKGANSIKRLRQDHSATLKPMALVERLHGHPNQVAQGRPSCCNGRRRCSRPLRISGSTTQTLKTLHAKIGQLALENDFGRCARAHRQLRAQRDDRRGTRLAHRAPDAIAARVVASGRRSSEGHRRVGPLPLRNRAPRLLLRTLLPTSDASHAAKQLDSTRRGPLWLGVLYAMGRPDVISPT